MLISYNIVNKVIKYAERLKLIDIPNERSSHENPVPRGGGIGIVCALVCGLTLSFYAGILIISVFQLYGYIVSIIILAFIGFLDDKHTLSETVKIVCQFFLALSIIFIVGRPEYMVIYGIKVSLGIVAVGIYILWIVGFINSYNFMDGINGLAGLQGVITGVFIAIMGHIIKEPSIIIMGIVLSSAIIGFLWFNFPNAKIFMGDVGSTVIGFYIAVIAVMQPILLFPITIVMGAFIYDTAITLFIRIIKREKWYKAHRTHFYQRAISCGYTHKHVTLFMCAISIVLGILSIVYLLSGYKTQIVVTLLSFVILSLLSYWVIIKELEAKRTIGE